MLQSQEKSRRARMLRFFIFLIFFILASLLFLFLGKNFHKNQKSNHTSSLSASIPIVIIDAGHGGEDGGAVGVNGAYEKDINLSIAKKLSRMLEAAGIQTVMTRTDDRLLYDRNTDYEGRKKVLDMQARLAICDQYDNAVFVSIHQNTFSQEQYSGLQVYYSGNHPQSLTLAEKIQGLSAKSVCPNNDRKVKAAGTNIFLLHEITLPAVLVECGFLSNVAECQKLSTEEYQRELAVLLCASLLDFFDQQGYFQGTGS